MKVSFLLKNLNQNQRRKLISKLFRVQGEYTYTVFKIVEADNEEEAILTAQDSEPLCAWETVEKNGYEEYVESAVEEKTNE